jgi:hypothetical protein
MTPIKATAAIEPRTPPTIGSIEGFGLGDIAAAADDSAGGVGVVVGVVSVEKVVDIKVPVSLLIPTAIGVADTSLCPSAKIALDELVGVVTFEAGCADALVLESSSASVAGSSIAVVEGTGVEVISGVLATGAMLVVEATGAGATTSGTLTVS